MRKAPLSTALIVCASVTLCCAVKTPRTTRVFAAPAEAAPTTRSQTQLPATMEISQKTLAKFKTISVEVNADGKNVTYKGVPLRAILGALLPESDLDAMPDWKDIARREVVIEVTGDDGYPGLMTGAEVLMNRPGDRFILATTKNEHSFDTAVQLICKLDETHLRWVRKVVKLRVVSLSDKPRG